MLGEHLCSHGFPKKPGAEGTDWQDSGTGASRGDSNLAVTKHQLQVFTLGFLRMHVCVSGSGWFKGSVHVKLEVV